MPDGYLAPNDGDGDGGGNPTFQAVLTATLVYVLKKGIECTQALDSTKKLIIHHIRNGVRPTKDWCPNHPMETRYRSMLLRFAGFRPSKEDLGISFSVRATAAELLVVFVIWQFCRLSSLDLMSSAQVFSQRSAFINTGVYLVCMKLKPG